jgi:hypothetical protein
MSCPTTPVTTLKALKVSQETEKKKDQGQAIFYRGIIIEYEPIKLKTGNHENIGNSNQLYFDGEPLQFVLEWT